MRIRRVEIENFRCLDKVSVSFDQITTFIGPNGAGKSSVLRALDWFFNGDKSLVLTEDDVFSGAEDKRISVMVEFEAVSAKDREILKDKYAPTGVDDLTVWRLWEGGKDKITGKAFAFLPFEDVRTKDNATDRKASYLRVVAEHGDLVFPSWTNDGAAEQMMSGWERENRNLLETARVSDTNFFGFAGQGRLSGLFDFVLITADLRASEESQDNKTSIIGSILEKAVDRTAADSELQALGEDLAVRHRDITKRHFASQLETLSQDLTVEVTSFAPGRSVEIGSIPSEFRPQVAKFGVKIDDHGTKTNVDRQGHGFQRSLLVAALKLLAQRGASGGDESVILLAIEEPELFQHPAQAKSFASVLRKLAEDGNSGLQIAYATHSPYFVEPTYFDQIRRVERNVLASIESQVTIHHASMDKVVALLTEHMAEADIRARLDNSCLNELRDALFASSVLLVEGMTDRALYEGVADAAASLSTFGVEVAVAGSKSQIFLPAAILTQLKIPFLTVFDSDSKSGDRVRAKNLVDGEVKAIAQELADSTKNRALLKFLGLPQQDWPVGLIQDIAAVADDTLEAMVASSWLEFEQERQALVASNRGSDGKSAATYRLAARVAANPPTFITDVISKVKGLVH